MCLAFQIGQVSVPQGSRKKKILMKAGAPKNGRRSVSHTRKAYQGIRRMLFHGEIVPGQKIGYRDLAERLGMSQTPVIQALKWLEFQKIVRHEPNRGYYTEPVSIREVEEIYSLRELIELDLLERTMGHLEQTGLDRLKEALQAHARAARQVYLFERLARDMTFHLTLAELSGRPIAVETLRNLFDRLYLKYGGSILFSTSMQQAANDHKALYHRIESGDAAGARAVLCDHIRRVCNHVTEGLHLIKAEKKGSVV